MAANRGFGEARVYLLNLSSRRATNLFLAAFVVGSLSIWFDFLVPWLPALLVIAYGSVLLYTARSLLITHSEMTNNSPYFLGFLFFLTSLFATFTRIGGVPPEHQTDYILHQLGVALLTTVVGLPFRQLLFAYAPAQQDQDRFYRTLEEELRQSASQFRKAQTQFVELLQEFILTRESLFVQEENASRRYVSSLEKAITVFDESFQTYPTQIATALSKCAAGVTKIKNKLDQLAMSSESLKGVEFNEALVQLTSLTKTASDGASGLKALTDSASSLAAVTNGLPERVRLALDGANAAAADVLADFRKKIGAIAEDIEAIDAILSDFVAVTRERIEALREERAAH